MFCLASLIYGSVVRLRNMLYDHSILTSRDSALPSICVGNLAVGGTGKTPHSEYLLRNLHCSKAYVSRGYHRKSRGMVVADDTSTSLDLGDEAYQIYRKFCDVQVVVSGDRHKAVDYLKERRDIDLVILDDAFQHRNIRATVNIILTEYASDPRQERMLPCGRMRDTFSSIKRADIVVVTKCPSTITPEEMSKKRRELNITQPILFSYMKYGRAYGVSDGREITLQGKTLLLFTGIEKPAPLAEYLGTYTSDLKTLTFPDHHDYTRKDIEKIIRTAQNCDYIVTTEKDYSRLTSSTFFKLLQDRLVVIPIEIDFIGDTLISFVTKYLGQHS